MKARQLFLAYAGLLIVLLISGCNPIRGEQTNSEPEVILHGTD